MTAMSPDDYLPLVQLALREDLGDRGDITTGALFSGESSQAVLVSKDSGILAGVEVFHAVYEQLDPDVTVEFRLPDGNSLQPGDTVADLSGPVASILTGERVAINFLAYLSGIATATGRFADAASSTGKARILDTRKTLPGYRALSKYAVRCGGGKNHRQGLYDMVLIKDNHIDFAGSVRNAVSRVRSKLHEDCTIEVECRTLGEVREALDSGIGLIMLDNMNEELVRDAIALRDGPGYGHNEFANAKFEASGNMDIESVKTMSRAGVDYISVGSLTHSVRSFDFSLVTEAP